MYVGGPLFGGEAFINNTWQTPGRLFKGTNTNKYGNSKLHYNVKNTLKS